MTELTIDQALQKAIAAHKAGQVQEADRLYTAILKAQPKHPDANHNMGILAVGVGKVEQALPFFKAALEANPATAQFWLSYIDALIRVDKLAEAKAVLDQAKTKGAKGDGFNKLENRLLDAEGRALGKNKGLFETAIQLRESGKYKLAIDLLKTRMEEVSSNPSLLALLSHCYILDDNLEEANGYLNKAKKLAPDISTVGCNEVRLLVLEKNITAALRVAKRIINKFSYDLEVLAVVGACFRANQDFKISLKYLNKAINIQPNHAEALTNRSLIYLATNNKANALIDLEKAYKNKPHNKKIWDLIIHLKIEFMQFSEAIVLLNEMIKREPNNAKRYANRALCYKNLNKFDNAIADYKESISLKPDYAESYNNIGNILKDQNKLNDAIEAYNKALTLQPDSADIYYNISTTLKAQGKTVEAIDAYRKSLVFKPNYLEALSNMGVALQSVSFNKPILGLEEAMISLLDQKTLVRPSDIAPAAISLLKFDAKLQKHLQEKSSDQKEQSLHQTVSELASMPLLLKLMAICPLPDLGLEVKLKKLRARILFALPTLEINSYILQFQSALALQCFTNEYIYDCTMEEKKALMALEASVETSLYKGEQPSPKVILCLASYKALHNYEWFRLLSDSDALHDVFTRQIIEPEREIILKSTIPTVEEITDNISVKVRAQYEENPYPRWVNLGIPLNPSRISDVVNRSKIKLFSNKICEIDKPDILVAGCGTGQHSISTAARFRNSNILAIDLSLSSLAYAKRKTEELGFKNISYMQADILKLKELDRQFDIIESVGVLHHMKDPMAGWKVLADSLKSGGLMKIGLYSELARQYVVKIRQEIGQSRINANDIQLKLFRSSSISSNQVQHKLVRSRSDFYSYSALRDLLFNVQEHRFTITQLKQGIEELGLEFCGFDSEKIVSKFKMSNVGQHDQYDLDNWQNFEASNPSTFIGMYQFWCQKPVGVRATRVQNPPQAQMNSLFNMYNQGSLALLVNHCQVITEQYPRAFTVWNLLGVSAAQIGKLDQAIDAFQQAITIKPDYADAHNNMGNAFKDQGKLENALAAYNKAITIRPDYAEVYCNMGNVLHGLNRLEESASAYKKALILKPDDVNANTQLGHVLKDHGNLEEAIECFNTALELKPDCTEQKENSLNLQIQTHGTSLSTKLLLIDNDTQFDTKKSPKVHIYKAINSFLLGNQSAIHKHIQNFESCGLKSLSDLKHMDQVFCSAYRNYLKALLKRSFEGTQDQNTENLIYHIGESHCLSYAHQVISIGGIKYRVTPRITFGAKAFHFSQLGSNKFKAFTKNHLASLPKRSEAFISFGEIDCRPNEGLISAASKLGQPMAYLITSTVAGYLQWFIKQNQMFNHSMHFLNVPAPKYDKNHSLRLNMDVAHVVKLFNIELGKQVANAGLNLIDVHSFTLGKDGFCNNEFHIDEKHLGPKAIPRLELQLGN